MAKFFRRGVSKIEFLPTVAGTSPTRAEITAGTDLSPFIREMKGFELTNNPIPTPNLASKYTTQIPGEDTTPDSTLTMDDDNASSTIRTVLAKGTTGFILLLPYGDISTKRCEIWAVTVTGLNDAWTVDNKAADYIVGFAVTAVPNQAGVVPV